MGSSTTRLNAKTFTNLLGRALWDSSEQWTKKWREKQGEVYEIRPYPGYEVSWTEAEEIDHTIDGYRLEGVDSGGGMDEGSNAYVVVKVTHPDGTVQHFRKDGYYASHDGYYWDGDLYEVKPVDKVVTFYEERV